MDINTYNKFKSSGEDSLKLREFNLAIECFIKCLNEKPEDVGILTLLAASYEGNGQNDLSVDVYGQALAIDPVHTSNLLKYSTLKLHGPNYIDLLKRCHLKINPKRYIEIGVCKGVSFSLADVNTIAIGIDPEPQLDLDSLPAKHKVISDTSDRYFASGKIEEDLQGKPFDMAFLDGMHLFEFALRDFMNLEKYSHGGSTVFVHDLFPMNAETATRERNSDFWSGDVWKLVLCLKEYRPDLELAVLPCPPTGLGVINKLDANSTVLVDQYEEILEKYQSMPFDVIENNREEKLLLTSLDHPLLSL